MSRKALKVLVELKFIAVSCPGVHLPARDDIYLSMCFMGQLYQSESLPAIFPLLFHEKMTFEKIFRDAVDPGQIAEMLEYEIIKIDLVQSVPPVGVILACCEENARSFLFPEPKLVPPFSGVDRELLMMRAPHFPGIAPKLEFSTKTTITECLPDAKMNIYPNTLMRSIIKRKPSSRPKSSSPHKKHLQIHEGRPGVRAERHSTAGSPSYIPRSQSLSPLRVGNTYRLARLSLDCGASFPSTWDARRSQPVGETSEDNSHFLGARGSFGQHHTPDVSALWRSYREHARHSRSESSSHRKWEEVHERVRGLLTTPKAVCRLTYGATFSEIDKVSARM